jgi:hypothetical protein
MAKPLRLARDIVRLNSRYLRDPDFRRLLAPTHARRAGDGSAPAAADGGDSDRLLVPEAATAYRGLTPFSTRLAMVRTTGRSRTVNVVVPDVSEGAVFAGQRTALRAGMALGHELGLPVRVVLLDPTDPYRDPRSVADILQRQLGAYPNGLDVVPAVLLPETTAGAADVWCVTHWTTAHAADVAARAGLLDPARVVYLVQDYEPGFNPWSTYYALARATYHAGFHLLVNSTPLNAYLDRHEGVHAADTCVFAPALELDRLAAAAAARERSDRARLFLYARPSHPRNLYAIGVAALRLAVRRLVADGVAVDAVGAGEPHPAEQLAPGVTLRPLGRLVLDDYFALLSRVDVGVSLQHSPHPSHPPLDLAVSGARAVTNDFGGTRGALHPRLAAVDADPGALADALVTAARRALDEGAGGFEPPPDGLLGVSLESAVTAVAARLPAS